MSGPNQADRMLALAAKDIKALRALIEPDAADDEIFGFHAQQAVEKSLKAWISAAGGEYGRTHDLQQLFLLLQDTGHSIDQFEYLIELNPFAVQMRYDLFDDDEPVIDRQTMLRRVVEFFAHVQGLINTP